MNIIDLESGENGRAPIIHLPSGCDLSVVGLGTYSLQGNTCINAICDAIQTGYRLIDTASLYGNETEVGKGIKQSGVAREEIFLQTKLYPNQYSNADKAIDEALQKLDADYIDAMLLHHPAENDLTAYAAIEKAIQTGKIRTTGISCYYIQETNNFLPKVSIKPEIIQNEIHPLYQDNPVVKYIQQKGITLQSWYPLGGRRHITKMLQNPTLQEIAHNHKKSVAQIILRWHLQRGITVIPGSSNPTHLQENISIFNFSLTPKDMNKIAALNKNEKHDWY